ncbi:MAG: YhfC family glutamic-type intramembrane protease [Rhizomicrobium sp.]|jgi:uncharacterized membrane protein YhfC
MIVPQSALAGLACAALISLLTPFVVYAFCRRRMVLALRNIALGAFVFVLFAMVLEGALHWYVIKINPAIWGWLVNHAWAFAAYIAGAAALFEETGRFIAMRFFVKRTGDPGTAVAYALGHGGIESIIIGAVAQAGGLFMSIMLNMGKLDAMFAHKIPPATIAKLYAHLDFTTALLGGAERVSALMLQIALSLLVWRAVSTGKARWFFAALALHAGVDSVAALFQKGQLSFFAVEGFVGAVGAVLLIFFLFNLPRKTRDVKLA